MDDTQNLTNKIEPILRGFASVHRFEIPSNGMGDWQKVMLPKQALIVHFDSQVRTDEKGINQVVLSVWAVVDTRIRETEERTFMVIATGQAFPVHVGDMVRWRGTAKLPDDFTMFHLFEQTAERENNSAPANKTADQTEEEPKTEA